MQRSIKTQKERTFQTQNKGENLSNARRKRMKIDMTNIPGYSDSMSDTEKLNLLLGYNIPEPDYSGYVKKEVFDNTARDLSEYKKKCKALEAANMTEAEKNEQAAKEAEQIKTEYDKKLAALELRETLMAHGFTSEDYGNIAFPDIADVEVAKQFATSLCAAMQAKINAAELKIKDSLLGNNTPPESGNASTAYADYMARYNEAVKQNNYFEMAKITQEAAEKGVKI